MANKKISQLALLAAASISATDIAVFVDDLGGTPTTYKASVADVRSALLKGSGGAAAGWTGTDYLALGGGTLPSTGRVRVGLGAITADDPILNATATWNAGGTTFRGILFNFTDTASAAGSLFADFQIGGATKWKVDKVGTVTQAGALAVGGALTVGGLTTVQALIAASAVITGSVTAGDSGLPADGFYLGTNQGYWLGGATRFYGWQYDGTNVTLRLNNNDTRFVVTPAGTLTLANLLLMGTSVTAGTAAGDVVLANARSIRGVNAANNATASLIQRNAAGVVLIDADLVGAATGGPLIVGAAFFANGLIQANAGLTVGAGAFTITPLAGAGTGIVSAGANDSAGAGFRWLRLPNA